MGAAFILVELFVAQNAPLPLKLPLTKLPVPKLPVPTPEAAEVADTPDPLCLDAFTAASLPVPVEGGRAAFIMDVVSEPPRWPPLAPPPPELAEVKLAASDWDWED